MVEGGVAGGVEGEATSETAGATETTEGGGGSASSAGSAGAEGPAGGVGKVEVAAPEYDLKEKYITTEFGAENEAGQDAAATGAAAVPPWIRHAKFFSGR